MNLIVGGRSYHQIPRIFQHLQENATAIVTLLYETDTEELAHYWSGDVQSNNKLERWLELVSYYAGQTLRGSNLDVVEMIRDRLNRR